MCLCTCSPHYVTAGLLARVEFSWSPTENSKFKKILHDVIRTTFVRDSSLEEEVGVTWDLRNRCTRLAWSIRPGVHPNKHSLGIDGEIMLFEINKNFNYLNTWLWYHLLDFKCLGFACDTRTASDVMLKMVVIRAIRRSPGNNVGC